MNLQPDQEEKLVNFQAITEHWDTDSSLQILERNNWDLEKATFEFMSNSYQNEDLAYFSEVVPEPQQVLETPLVQVSNEPRLEQPKPGFFAKIKNFFHEILTPPIPLYSESAQSLMRKVQDRRPEHLPRFFTGLLKDAVLETNRMGRLLVMYLSSESVEYTIHVLCNEAVVRVINQNYLLWAVEKTSTDGILAEKLLRASEYPCLAIVSVQNPSTPVVIDKLQGRATPRQVVEFLNVQISPVFIRDPRQEQLERERKLRAAQDEELKEAERILQERNRIEKQKVEEEKRRKEVERKEREKKEEEVRKKMESIGEEPDGPDATLVSFRLPDGRKIDRKFGKERTVQVLYDFLEVSGFDAVEILYGFPACVLGDRGVGLEEAGLHPKALVIVRNS